MSRKPKCTCCCCKVMRDLCRDASDTDKLFDEVPDSTFFSLGRHCVVSQKIHSSVKSLTVWMALTVNQPWCCMLDSPSEHQSISILAKPASNHLRLRALGCSEWVCRVIPLEYYITVYNKIAFQTKANHAPMAFLLRWPWPDDLDERTWPRCSKDAPAHQKLSFEVKAFKS